MITSKFQPPVREPVDPTRLSRGNGDYQSFLHSPYWKYVRGKAKARAGFKCELCSSKPPLQVTHRRWNNFRNEHEHIDDLIAVCPRCAESIHSMHAKNKARRQ